MANIDQQLRGDVSAGQRQSLQAERARVEQDVVARGARTPAAQAAGVGVAPTVRGRNDPNSLFGREYEARQQAIQDRAKQQETARRRTADEAERAAFFAQQTPTGSAPAGAPVNRRDAPPVQQTPPAAGLTKPARVKELESATRRVELSQAGWNEPASPKQQTWLTDLATRARANTKEGSPQRAVANELVSHIPKLTKWEASQFIDGLREPKPISTLMDGARAAAQQRRAGEKPLVRGLALFALPTFRSSYIARTLNDEAAAEGLPF